MIELRNVAFGYGSSYTDRDLFSDLTLSLVPGSFQFLTGASGAGKTTLIRLLHGDLLPTAGEVSLFGQSTLAMSRDALALARRRIGYVAQEGLFLDHLTVAENIMLPLTIAGRQAEAEGNIGDLLAWVGLRHRADHYPPALAGAERQCAALARAVTASPEAVILDEPTAAIDREAAQHLLSLLIELNRMGRAVLVATHDLDLIRAASGQVAARSLRLADRRLTLMREDP